MRKAEVPAFRGTGNPEILQLLTSEPQCPLSSVHYGYCGGDADRVGKRLPPPRASSATAASEPRRAFDRGMRIITGRDGRRLCRCPGGPDRRHPDANDHPLAPALGRDPRSIGMGSPPAFNLSDCLFARNEFRIAREAERSRPIKRAATPEGAALTVPSRASKTSREPSPHHWRTECKLSSVGYELMKRGFGHRG